MYSAIGVEPTKLTDCTRSSVSSTSTASLSPLTMFSTPAGSPASASSSPISMVALGSFSDGLSTKVLPQAMATGSIHSGTMAGKLNGVMPTQTPNGCISELESMSRPTLEENSPLSRCGMPQANSTTSSPRVTSPWASEKTLPCSLVISRATSSRRASSSALKRNITRARTSGGVFDQPSNAAWAAAMASRVSSAEDSDTYRRGSPVAGL